MAQIALSQAGTALGAALLPNGLNFLGLSLSGVALGGALGGIAGAAADSRLFGRSAEGPRVDGLHVMESREGAGIPLVYGRFRVGGQVIWAARFTERREETRAGKGGPSLSNFSYSVSFAVALGLGEVTRINRVWANGEPLALGEVAHRLYPGGEDQAPDPLIEAVEGAGCAPAYRGTAYVVFEDLPLDRFGNRLPQLSFEIVREPPRAAEGDSLKTLVSGVNLIPASGEFVYGTDVVRTRRFPGIETPQNMNNGDGRADMLVSLDQLERDLPSVSDIALTIGWFGTDLRAGACAIRPGVELAEKNTTPYAWSAGGVSRSEAHLISGAEGGAPNYGGTPADRSIVQAIRELNGRGLAVTVSPFLFMDIPAGNGLPDPHGGAEQAAFPWRGRIVTDAPDKTAAARVEVDAFLGGVQTGDFEIDGDDVRYLGDADDRGFRRFILHQAFLAKAAGGVEAFLLGSEMVGLSRIRDDAGAFPFVDGLRALASDVKAILGPATKVSYAADWTEYGAYAPGDGSGDVLFPLDPLWADGNVDFVGVDWYPPAGDWRGGTGHLDAQAGFAGPDETAYIAANLAGGEAYDWFYANQADRDAQIRTPITDTAHGEDWVFRQKDLENWWSNAHHPRPGGVRAGASTDWVPASKPVRLSEIGFPAVDKGTNSPNLFYDPKSAESALPPYSNGARDDVLQRRALESALTFWRDRPFVEAALVWAWDARPWPDFPSRSEVWSDGPNWAFGHWLNGRAGLVEASDAIVDLGRRGGVEISARVVDGLVDGYAVTGVATLRAALEPLKTVHGFVAVERGDELVLRASGAEIAASIGRNDLIGDGAAGTRTLLDKAPGALRLQFLDGANNHQPAIVEARIAGADPRLVADVSLPVALSAGQAEAIAARLLDEAAQAERLECGLTHAGLAIEPGDMVDVENRSGRWIVSDIVDGEARALSLRPAPGADVDRALEAPPAAAQAALFAEPEFVIIDAPALAGAETDARPVVAATAKPWAGDARVLAGPSVDAMTERATLDGPAALGRLAADLPPGPVGRWDENAALLVETPSASFVSAPPGAVFAGANGVFVDTLDGWELLQFQTAEIVGPELVRLRRLLRGQRGTSASGAPRGAVCVLADANLRRVDLAPEDFGVERVFRIADRGGFSPVRPHVVNDFAALPWRPAHLRAAWTGEGLQITWTARRPEYSDNWEFPERDNSGTFRLSLLAEGDIVDIAQATSGAWMFPLGVAQGADEVRVSGVALDGRIGAAASIFL